METEVLDISSDSNETLVEPKVEEMENEIFESLPQKDSTLDYLVKKYLVKKVESTETCVRTNSSSENDLLGGNKCNKRNKYDWSSNFEHKIGSSDDGDLFTFSNNKKLKVASNDSMKNFITNSGLDKHECETNTEFTVNLTKEQQKMEKERIRQEKIKIKEQKKDEEKRNKAIKDALTNHYKNMKPENCIKFIKVQVDVALAQEGFSKYIIGELQTNGVSYITKSHDISSTITWRTQLDSHILNSDGQLIDTSEGTEINEVLLILKCNDLLAHIHNKTFLPYIENIYMNLSKRKTILAIYGLGKYYQYQKRNKTCELKEDISGKSYRNSKDERVYANIPLVSRRTVEYALTEIQLLYSISHKMVDNEQDLASFVFQLTKSIAQAPYKKEKQDQFIQSRWFMSEDNKNCIKIDKNGNGLARLWKQVITTFPLASLETAEAITAIYPTPLSLFKAYENISDTNEGEKLLQDIPIRRAAGPISTMRKIGPELSRKVYYLFTSIDPDTAL